MNTKSELHSTFAVSITALIREIEQLQKDEAYDKMCEALYWNNAIPGKHIGEYSYACLNITRNRRRSTKEQIKKRKDAIRLLKKMIRML